MTEPDKIIGQYCHYKGGLYTVLGVAEHSETLEQLVVYRCEYDSPGYPKGSLWVRPWAMFFEKVMYCNQEVPRFERIS